METKNETPFEVTVIPSKWPDGSVHVTLLVKGTFEVKSNYQVEVAQEQLPILYADEPVGDKGAVKFEADIAPFKPRVDLLLVGQVHSPRGEAVTQLDAYLRVGNLKKIVRVIGDRKWKRKGLFYNLQPTLPKSFKSMPLELSRSFGGLDEANKEACLENIGGAGFISKKGKKVQESISLPNFENPLELIKSPNDHPIPTGVGFYPRNSRPRVDFMGTYDKKWEEGTKPEVAEDFDFAFYNAAFPDLQVPYLEGNEEVELINFTRNGHLEFSLPDKLPHANLVMVQTYSDGQVREEQTCALRLDTLCLLPDEQKFFLLWRGNCKVSDWDMAEVESITYLY